MTDLLIDWRGAHDYATQPTMLRVRGKDVWEGWITSDVPLGIYTHFEDGRSVPCGAALGKCTKCDARESRRFRGYVSYGNVTLKRHHVLEVTDSIMCEWSRAGLVAADTGLRGLSCSFWREGGADRGRMMCKWNLEARPSFKLVGPLDVRTVVRRLYGL